MIKIIINGCYGKMGRIVLDSVLKKSDEFTVVAGVDSMPGGEEFFPIFEDVSHCYVPADVIIDFSRPEALSHILDYAVAKKIAIVIATTGLTSEHHAMIAKAGKEIPVFVSANMSLGVNLQLDLIKRAAAFLGDPYDIEIIEMHHNTKIDSPSGTAYLLADAIKDEHTKKHYVFGRHTKTERRAKGEIGIHAVRGGTIVGEHQVHFIGDNEVVEIRHSAQSRQIFAAGALRAAKFIVGKPARVYTMQDLVAEVNAVTKIYKEEDQAIIALSGVPYSTAKIAAIFGALKQINLDMISQTAPVDGAVGISFTLSSAGLAGALAALEPFKAEGIGVSPTDGVAKLSVEGFGMEFHHGVTAKFFGALEAAGVSARLVTTSETKILCCVTGNELPQAFAAMEKVFSL